MSLDELEASIGYSFKDKSLLVRALTTRSYALSKKVKSYDRLEFLGNFVLDLFIGEYLYRIAEERDEHTYSNALNTLRSNVCLAEIGKRLGIDRAVITLPGYRLGTKTIADAVEAVIAVIYLESGIGRAFSVLGQWFQPELEILAELQKPGTMIEASNV